MLAAVALAAGIPASAQDEPRFCPNRPDLGASGCTTKPGEVQVEWSTLDWERDDSADGREDSFLAADVLARIGVGSRTELQIGWSPFGRVRTRDAATGAIETVRGVSDVRLAVRQSLSGQDGKGLSFGIEPFVTVPVGRVPIGRGDWGAGLVVPADYDLGGSWTLGATAQVEAAVDEDGAGRHLAYSGILGLGRALSDRVSVSAEVMVAQDDDPLEPTTQLLGAASFAWQPTKRFQLDLLATAGLNRDTPDVRLVTGGAILF
jgi:hypothetical protein